MLPRAKPRLKEIAATLGVSITTVSRALAGYPDVSADTRRLVRETAERLGYVPSRVGRMLVSGRTDFIGMLLSVHEGQLADSFLGQFVGGLSKGLADRGKDLFIATVTEGQSDLKVLGDIIDGNRADAIVINRTRADDERIDFLLDRRFPFVAHGRRLDQDRPFAWYDTDGETAFAMAATQLIGLGHHRFGLLTITENFTFAAFRRRGLEGALHRAGLDLKPDNVAAVPFYDRQAAEAAVSRLLGKDDRPTALVAVVDSLAMTALDVARRLGVDVPGDISVIGFDNVPVAAYTDPPLSTFDQQTHQSGAAMAAMVVELIGKPGATVEPRLIEPPFVPRESHGPAPPERRAGRGKSKRAAGPRVRTI